MASSVKQAAVRKRKDLTLDEKIAVIRASAGKSQRQLAEEFKISKTQVCNILQRRDDLLEMQSQANPAKKRPSYASKYSDIDEITWRWFSRVRASNIPVSGPMIQEKAKEFATQLNKPDFKASSGWLQRFKDRHLIREASISGERGSVDLLDVDVWVSTLPDLLHNYPVQNIFNMDETGLLFRALPDKTLAVRGSDCAGGKKSKERLTVSLCVNALGEFETPLVIGRAATPRCFRGMGPHLLPVTWKANRKAWMTGDIFREWLRKFNAKMKGQNRKVLLFIDNASSHSKETLSNVTMHFLPPNTTSVLQPLDLGVIRNVKCHYRNFVLRNVLSKIESGQGAETIAKSINVLDACYWIKEAVKKVKADTVRKCFRKGGFEIAEGERNDIADCDDDDEDVDALLASSLECLDVSDPCSVAEYAEIDSEIPTEELAKGWEDELLSEFVEGNSQGDLIEDNDSGDEDEIVCRVKNFSQALTIIDDLTTFAAEKNLEQVISHLYQTKDIFQNALLKERLSGHQSTLDDYFKK